MIAIAYYSQSNNHDHREDKCTVRLAILLVIMRVCLFNADLIWQSNNELRWTPNQMVLLLNQTFLV